jgi:hypothetical protein
MLRYRPRVRPSIDGNASRIIAAARNRAEASSEGYKELGRAKKALESVRCWTAPTLSEGRIFTRNSRGDLVCLDVKGK